MTQVDVLPSTLTTPSPSDALSDAASSPSLSTTRHARRERDDVFWTELEIRRLSNLVAEAIHSNRYIGSESDAVDERAHMRVYIDAMKRKAMRVLNRAELYAEGNSRVWPGIDPTITDPLSLAEEYVKLVENYLAVLAAEEERIQELEQPPTHQVTHDPPEDVEHSPEDPAPTSETQSHTQAPSQSQDDWEVQDEIAYEQAVKRDRDERRQLVGEKDGMRRRRAADENASSKPENLSKEDEEFMDRHQPVQDQLTSNLADLVGQLKQSVTSNKEKLDRDANILDQTETAVDKNADALKAQREKLGAFVSSSSMSWWMMVLAAVFMVLVFLIVLLLSVAPM